MKYFVFLLFSFCFLTASAQREDLAPLLKPNVDSIIRQTDSLRFQLFPTEYHKKYMLLDKIGTGGWPPVPFMPDVFSDLVTYPDSGSLRIPYGKFQAHSLSFYDYGGVHFHQINLAPVTYFKQDSTTTEVLSEENMVTITLANSFGKAWIRFDEEAESDNWLEVFVEKDMEGFGPKLSEIREGSYGEGLLDMFLELFTSIKAKQ